MSASPEFLKDKAAWIAQTRERHRLGPTINKAQLFELIGRTYSSGQLIILEKDGKIPRRVPLMHGATVWVTEEVLAWLADRILNREAANEKRATDVRPVVDARIASQTARGAA